MLGLGEAGWVGVSILAIGALILIFKGKDKVNEWKDMFWGKSNTDKKK